VAYPTGDKATSVILLERFVPAEVRASTDFAYQIRLTNLTRLEVRDLVLTELFPAGFKVRATAPRTVLDSEGRGTWKWAALAPGGTELIRVEGSTDRTEPLWLCGSVTFSTGWCANVNVVEPRLTLTKSAPREVLTCDPIPLQLIVSNSGTGVIRNVRITDALPDGWSTMAGQAGFVLNAGDLAAGQSRQFSVTVQALGAGTYHNRARAEDDSGLTAEAATTTIVRQPILAVTKRGPDVRYLGRAATFEITVQNTGDAPARDTVLTDPLPPGTELLAAEGGQLVGGTVTWNLGTLAPQTARTVRLTIKPNEIGTVRNTALAQAYCARGSAAATLHVRGIPAILLEVVDHPDPIEIGGNVTYTIEVTNQGSAASTNITIDCTLPEELQYVSATGPAPVRTTGSDVRFAPLASLAPKAKATYQVVAKGVLEGDARFKVSMNSDQTTSPVEETESTQIY
jgi:uncharacterized repeat protein (TIGR01451 family)